MTDEQFDVVTSLMRMSSQPILVAARLVLVNGERLADAAREAGCRPNHLARDTAKIMATHNALTSTYSRSKNLFHLAANLNTPSGASLRVNEKMIEITLNPDETNQYSYELFDIKQPPQGGWSARFRFIDIDGTEISEESTGIGNHERDEVFKQAKVLFKSLTRQYSTNNSIY